MDCRDTRSRLACCVLLVVAFLAGAAAQAPPRFEARLVEQGTDKPIAGASVSIAGASGSARTDEDGRFTWMPAPAVPFQMIVVLASGQVARPIVVETLPAGVALFRLSALADEAVTVLGAAPSVDTTPAAAATILSGAQIAHRGPENLMQALETVPGISQVSEGHAAAPAIRGLARGRTLLLVDGGRVTAERRVGPSSTFLDPSVIEGIDVARGPGSVAYGSDALGGVVSVRTRRAEPGSPLKARATGTIGAGIPEARGSFEVSKGLQRGGVLVQAHARGAGDYGSPDGEVFNSGWKDRGLLVHLTHAIGRGSLSAAWQSDFARDVERPRDNSRSVRFYYPFENSHRLTTSYQVPGVAGFRQIAVTGFLGGYAQRTDQDRGPTADAPRSIERADVSANDFHVKSNAERLAGRTRIEVGVDVNGRYNLEALDVVQAFDASGAVTADRSSVSVDDARRVDAAVYAQADSPLGIASLSAGIRVDRVTTTNSGGFFGARATANTAPSGFGAITVGPLRGVSVTGQLSRGFRDPVLSDRYFRGPSGRGFVTGNPELVPETSLQLDLATRYSDGRTQLAVYFYQYRVNDLIERYQAETDSFFFRNRGRARLRGIELEAGSQLGRGYSVEIAAQVSRGWALDDNAHLDDISPASLSLLGRKEFGNSGHAHARIAWHAADGRPGPSEVAAPGAVLLDAGAGWRVARRLSVRGLLRNLLDDRYYASPDPRWVLAPGRSISVTMVVEY